MKKPTLVVMAAGMGSRFGGLKQMTPVDAKGNSIAGCRLLEYLSKTLNLHMFAAET